MALPTGLWGGVVAFVLVAPGLERVHGRSSSCPAEREVRVGPDDTALLRIPLDGEDIPVERDDRRKRPRSNRL